MQVLADPVQRLQVAQAALALLDVRLQHIALAALPLVPLGPLGQLRLDELRPRVAEEIGPEPLGQFGRQRRVAIDESGVPAVRCASVMSRAGLDQAVLHRAAGMADLQLQVPEHVEHRLDDALGPGRGLPRRQEEKVHVRMRRHFRPAVAPDREHGDALALGRAGERVEEPRRHAEDDLDRRIHQCRIGAHGQRGRARVAGEFRRDGGQRLGPGDGQRLDDAGAAGARVLLLRAGTHETRAKSVAVEDRVAADRRGQGRPRRAGIRPGLRSPRRRSFLGQDQSRPPVHSGSGRRRARVRWSRPAGGGRRR
jgi:hypothetical protein